MNVEGEYVLAERAVEYFADVPYRMAAIRRLKAEALGLDELVRIARPVGGNRDLSSRTYCTKDSSRETHYAELQRPAKNIPFFHGFPSVICLWNSSMGDRIAPTKD